MCHHLHCLCVPQKTSEIELKELQVNANPSYRQATQFVEPDASSDGQ